MTIGEKIKKARTAAEMSQQELADILGIKCAGISQWETDKRTPKISSLRRIADALGIGLAELLVLPPEKSAAVQKLEQAISENEKRLQAMKQDNEDVSSESIAVFENNIKGFEGSMDYLILPAKLEHQADLARKRTDAMLAAREKKKISPLLQENLALEFHGISPEQKEVCSVVCQIVDSSDEGKALGGLLSAYEKLNDEGRAELIKRSMEMLYVPAYTETKAES